MKKINDDLLVQCINLAEKTRKLELEQEKLEKAKEKVADELNKIIPQNNDHYNGKYLCYDVDIHHGVGLGTSRPAFRVDVHEEGKRIGFTWFFGSDPKKK